MTTLLPTDANNHAIPAMRFKEDGAHSLSISETATRNAQAFTEDTKIISLYATVPVYIAFGDSSITASSTDHYFPAGVYYDIAIETNSAAQHTHISALRVDSNGTLYISEKE